MFANLPVNHVWDGAWTWHDLEEQIEEILNEQDWYEDEGGYMYIVTEDDIEGPENEIADSIADAYRHGDLENGKGHGWGIAAALGISFIPVVLRRFDTGIGFYHA